MEKMQKITIELYEHDLVALLLAGAKKSCGYSDIAKNMDFWWIDCCELNDPVLKAAKQVDLEAIKDDEHREFIQKIVEIGKIQTFEPE